MPDSAGPCDPHLDLVRFQHRLCHLTESLCRQRKIKIVAIGSSSTAGENDVIPFPHRLELALRNRFPDRMIDVLNRGIGGQEAPEELARFESDVVTEAPTLVIWQVGTNAIFHRCLYDPHRVATTIATGVSWLKGLETDVILMDLQYAPILLEKHLDDTRLMVSLIGRRRHIRSESVSQVRAHGAVGERRRHQAGGADQCRRAPSDRFCNQLRHAGA